MTEHISPLLSESFIFPNGTFVDKPDARFAAGLISVNLRPVENRIFEHYAVQRVRGAVYVQQGFLSPESMGVDLTEIDENDSRSVGFAVLENMGTFADCSLQRVAGTMRYIEKGSNEDAKLPVEEFYPEIFEEPLPAGAIEVSRYIINHDTKDVVGRAEIRRQLFNIALSSVATRGLGPTYAVVDVGLARMLKHPSVGTPLEVVGENKFIEQYNTKNVPIIIDTESMAQRYGIVPADSVEHNTKYTYFDAESLERA